jgi:DNA polymerase delta subunit 4
MSRLERWERADKLGDEPPVEIKEILETRQGVLDLHQSVLADKGV